jgi:hypothetical protein
MTNYTIVEKHTCGHNLSIDLLGEVGGSWQDWVCNTCRTRTDWGK